MTENAELITGFATRGDGMTASGRYVAGAVPGDTVDDHGDIIPGPNRQTPPCPHFGRCGGCQFQHVKDEIYAGFITDRIVAALVAQKVPLPDIRVPYLSPPFARRRVALRAIKAGKHIQIGFAEGASHKLVNLSACPVMARELFALIAPMKKLLLDILPDRRPADIRMTLTDQGIDLLIAGGEAEGLAGVEAITDFARAHKLARLSLDEGYGPQVRWEPEPVTVTFGGVAVAMPDAAFLQATVDGEQTLVAAVRKAVGDAQETADLFSGLGTFTFALPGKVHAAEGARDAILSLQLAANRHLRPVTVEHRDLFRRPIPAADLKRFDAVVIDPPRAGAKEQVEELSRSAVPVIASVSCNPATFARDARILIGGGYKIDWIAPVGQFRWSTHVELAARFIR
jgi:23S rRNA (uracil1939-C5)-methyltransferase